MTQETIAENIRRIIQEKGMIQRVAAERAGFSGQQFSDMLNGRKIIRAEYLPPITGALGVDIKDLFAAGQDTACEEVM